MAAFCRRPPTGAGEEPGRVAEPTPRRARGPSWFTAGHAGSDDHRQVTVLNTLQTVISEVERLIAVRVVAHPRSNLFENLPGVGMINLALARRGRSDPRPGGQCRTSRDRVRRGACHPSLRPDPRRLLPLGREYPRAQGHHQLRSQRSNARRAGPPHSYADARARGKRNPHATRIVARAWLRVIWACWTSGQPYDPAVTTLPRPHTRPVLRHQRNIAGAQARSRWRPHG